MPDLQSAASLVLARLHRLVAFGRDQQEFHALSVRLHKLRTTVFADDVLTAGELDQLAEQIQAVTRRYDELAAREGLPASAFPQAPRELALYSEAAEIHFSYLAGDRSEHFRGGMLHEFRTATNPAEISPKIALDIATSASAPIAVSKIHLLRAAISMEDSSARRAQLFTLAREAYKAVTQQEAWSAAGCLPALPASDFERIVSVRTKVGLRRTRLPDLVRDSRVMMPNRPLPGWEDEVHSAVRAVLEDLSAAGILFVDGIPAGGRPRRVAMKVELNMGIEGAPSVSDPAVTGAVLFELLERAHARNVILHFTVGDSCGIENAPLGRTSMDILRETGNYHYALKAALRFVLRRSEGAAAQAAASQALNAIADLESREPPVFFGSVAHRESTPHQLQVAEGLAAPWVRCVDYDVEGFLPIRTELGPRGLAIWGDRDFQIARPWAEADHRVHVTRGCSTHLFAGWTGAVKGLIGLHALGMRPADQGLKERGQTAVDFLSWIMHQSGFEALIGRKGGLNNLSELAAQNEETAAAATESRDAWQSLNTLASLAKGWQVWFQGTAALDRDLRRELKEGVSAIEVMARLRRETRAILLEADRVAPGFRDALWDAAARGTRVGLLAAWKFRNLLPANMRDESMGMRIGLLSQVPLQAALVVQGLPKIGIGGGPDAYESVRDVGVVVAGTDEVSVDLIALRAAGVSGNPWSWNCPVHGALQFGRGPASWDEISVISPAGEPAVGGAAETA